MNLDCGVEFLSEWKGWMNEKNAARQLFKKDKIRDVKSTENIIVSVTYKIE